MDDELETLKHLMQHKADTLADLALTLGLLAIRIADSKSETQPRRPLDGGVPYELQVRPYHFVADSPN
jgi:hypothetical protein